MPVFLFLNDLAKRWPIFDETMRFLYVGLVPLLAMLLLARLFLFAPSRKAIVHWRVALGVMLAIGTGALLAYGLEYLIHALDLGVLSSRPFMTRRVNILVVEPQDDSFPCYEVALAAMLAMGCWFLERKSGYVALGMAVLLAAVRLVCGTNYFADVAVALGFGIALSLLGLAVAGVKGERFSRGIQAATGSVLLGALVLGVYFSFASNARFAAKLSFQTLVSNQSKAPETLLQGGEGGPIDDNAPAISHPVESAEAYALTKRSANYLPYVEKYLRGQLMLRAQPLKLLDVEVAPVNFEHSSYRSAAIRFQVDPEMPDARRRVAEIAARLVKSAFKLDSRLQSVDVTAVLIASSLEEAQRLDDSTLVFVGNEVPVFTASVQRKNLILKTPKWANLPNLDGGSWLRTRSRIFINDKVLAPSPATQNEPIPTPAPQH